MGARTVTGMEIVAFCVVMLTFAKHASSYSTGSPTRACADMTPGHGQPIKNEPAPFLVEVSKTQYTPNERIYVRIRACGASRFKGFLIQPRSAVYPERPAFLGAFLRVQGTRYECVRSGAVLTHSSSEEKQSVTMTWIAPPAAAGHVVFRVTVVQDFRNYWVGINSPVVYDGMSRDLTMMQAFILQSPTDKICLPGRQSATSTTESVPETTTEDLFMETTVAIEPTTTIIIPTIKTTSRPTTKARTTTKTTPASTKAPTTQAPQTSTTPTTLAPTATTLRTPTIQTTFTPTTPAPLPTDIFYDYGWETSTIRPEPTTTQRLTTTRTLQNATSQTTTPIPTTTEYMPPIWRTTGPIAESTTTLAPTTTNTIMIETTIPIDAATEIATEIPTTVKVTTTTIPSPPQHMTITTTRKPEETTPTPTTAPQPTSTKSTTNNPTTTIGMQEPTMEYVFVEDILTTTTRRPTTTTILPTHITIPTTIKELQYPTQTTTFQSSQTTATTTTTSQTTTSNLQTTTDAPMQTTQIYFDSKRTTQSLPPNTVRGLREPSFTTPVYRPRTELYPEYFDLNRVDTTIPPSYFDYLDLNRENSAVTSDTARPVYPDVTQISVSPSINVDTKQSSTVWVPTRPWYMPTQSATSTEKQIMFRPPASPVINVRLPYTTTNSYIPSTVVTMQLAPGQQPTIRVADLVLTPDPACGVTQGCFDDCSNGVCNYIVSWVPEKEKTVFEIRTKPRTSGQYWTAIGFSDDKMMGLDSVTECITEGDKISVYQSYNLDYYRNMRLFTPSLGISDQSGSYRDGIFHCKFTRENYVAGEKDVFDLSMNWHMMFAEGPAVNGIKIPHRYDVVPPVSKERIDIQQYPPVHETYDYRQALKENVRVVNVSDVTISPSIINQERRIAVDQECGSSRSCFQECSPSGCHFIVSWSSQDDYVTFRTRAVMNDTSNIWIAIAFSDDKSMGDDSVVQCVANENGEIDIRHSFNDGKNNVRIENSQLGLSNTSASLTDGIFECDFVRQRDVGDYEHIYNLDRKWNILFAHGKSKKGIMLPHSLDHRPHVSDDAVDFRKSAPSHITASTFFIKIHASIMIFAWILCASVASVVGRYFQPYWWGEKMLGSKVWIKVHWLSVLITCAAVIAGFTVIFVGVDGISELYEHPETGFNGTHPIMGLIVTLLALLNPLLLCLKPSEESSGRAFFNCLYWLVEIGAHVLAVVTIYAGFGLTSDFVPHFFTFMLIGFTVYQILVLLFMEFLKSFDAKKTIEKKKIYLYEMQIRPWHSRKNSSLSAYMDLTHTSKSLKQTAFATHLLLLSALTTTMLVLIITGYHE